MSSSGSYDFSVSRDDLIEDAYIELGSIEEGESLSAEQLSLGARRLNMVVKELMMELKTEGCTLWAVQDAVLFQVLGQQSYLLGDASTDANWCAADDYNHVELAADAASGATTITVDDDDDIAASDRIGVLLDDGTIHWTTVSGAPVANVVTLALALTDDAAEGNVVFTYTSRLVRPLKLVPGSIYRRDIDDNDTPIELVGKVEYDQLTAKTQRGKVIQVAYQELMGSGRLWTWPTADLATDVLRFSFERPLQDFDLTTDTPDFPIEASTLLYLRLAMRLCGPEGALEELPRVKALADEALETFLSWGVERGPVRFSPRMR